LVCSTTVNGAKKIIYVHSSTTSPNLFSFYIAEPEETENISTAFSNFNRNNINSQAPCLAKKISVTAYKELQKPITFNFSLFFFFSLFPAHTVMRSQIQN